MKRTISTTTILEPYGLVTISGQISRNPYHTFEERQFEPPFIVEQLKVTDETETIHGRTVKDEVAVTVCGLEQLEVELCEEILTEKYIEEEQVYKDTLIDEVIERGREYRHLAYS